MIPKFQQGGGFDSLFTIYKPIQIETPRQEKSSSRRSESKEEDTKGKLTEKDLFDMLEKLDGLPNEMRFMVRNMLTTLNNAKALGADGIQDLASTYLRNLYSLKEAKYNKEQFDNAYKQAVSNGSLNEAAIDPSGNVWVTDENGSLKSISPETWAKVKGSGEYQLVTNGNLLWMRSHLPQYANKNQLLRTVENGIGLDQVHKMIKDRFQQIGNTDMSTEQYVPKQAIKGYKIFEQMLSEGPDGVYKIKQSLSTPDQAQIAATLSYIYSTLPANAKTRLALETSDGSQKSIQDVISNMILGTVKTKQEYSIDYEGLEGKGVTKDGKSVKDDGMNAALKLIAGLGNPENFGINLGDEYLTIVGASTLGLVGGKNDDPLGVRKPMSDVLTSSLGNILDTRNMSIGMNIISPNELNRIIVEEPKIRSIDFPSKRNENGTIVPDLSNETRQKKRAADNELSRMGINPYNPNDQKNKASVINQVYQKHELPAPYNSDGSINNDNWTRFAIISVAADGRALKNADKSLLQNISDDYEAEGIISAIQESDEDYSDNRGMFDWFSDDIYKGTLWIPIIESYSMGSDTKSSEQARTFNEWDQALRNKAHLTSKQIY